MIKEVRDTLLPRTDIASATRMYTGSLAAEGGGDYSGPAELVLVKIKKTPWQKTLDSIREKVGGSAFVSAISAIFNCLNL